MPVIKSAKKKLRQDKKRQARNNFLRQGFKDAVKEATKSKTAEKVKKAVSSVDKAVKKGLMHKNKAARIKSRLSKLGKATTAKEAPKAAVKKAVKTAAKKKTVKAKK
jgi:small subunit ribosomal protein S20